MHFWVSVTRGGFQDGFCCPRKIGTNWFMPALVKSRFGASGMSGDDGTMVCFFSRKKSRNDCRIWAEVMTPEIKRDIQPDARTTATQSRATEWARRAQRDGLVVSENAAANLRRSSSL